MKSDAIAFGIAGILFGLIAGWIIGSQQGVARAPAPATAAASAPQSGGPGSGTGRAAVLDETQVNALKSVAEREASNATPRVQLGNLYFDAERYDEAIKWYGDAIKLSPKDVNVSTDLGVSYYYSNQPDKALEQFNHSLALDPGHGKTLLNVGIVKAFGKQDLDGAAQAWQQVIKLAPDSPEGLAAKRALDSLQSAHPAVTPGSPGAQGAARKPGA
jgi:tetratricopeptide (TPR) repeat protein